MARFKPSAMIRFVTHSRDSAAPCQKSWWLRVGMPRVSVTCLVATADTPTNTNMNQKPPTVIQPRACSRRSSKISSITKTV